MISSGVIAPPDKSSSAVSHLIDFANATAPPKYACGYFSAKEVAGPDLPPIPPGWDGAEIPILHYPIAGTDLTVEEQT
jgi:hypothetical protein